jgi:hypothetical protein
LAGFAKVTRDITERKKLDQQLQKAKEKAELRLPRANRTAWRC